MFVAFRFNKQKSYKTFLRHSTESKGFGACGPRGFYGGSLSGALGADGWVLLRGDFGSHGLGFFGGCCFNVWLPKDFWRFVLMILKERSSIGHRKNWRCWGSKHVLVAFWKLFQYLVSTEAAFGGRGGDSSVPWNRGCHHVRLNSSWFDRFSFNIEAYWDPWLSVYGLWLKKQSLLRPHFLLTLDFWSIATPLAGTPQVSPQWAVWSLRWCRPGTGSSWILRWGSGSLSFATRFYFGPFWIKEELYKDISKQKAGVLKRLPSGPLGIPRRFAALQGGGAKLQNTNQKHGTHII